MKKAVIIRPDFTTETVAFADTETIRDAVGGYIEAVYSGARMSLWCNEEGKLTGLAVNPAATALWWLVRPAMIRHDILVGPVLVAGGATAEGETLGLDDHQCELVNRHVSLRRTGARR